MVLILKLALGLFACGHCSVDVELFIGDAAAVLELPTPYISVGHRVLDVSFGSFGPHQLRCGRDLVFSGLADLTSLCTAIANGDCRSAHVGLRVCDELLERPLPYGWLVQILAFEGIGILASVVAYHGSVPYDTLGAAVNTAILIAAMHVGKLFRISHLELMLVCFAVGVGAPFVWHYLSNGGQPICHIGPQFIGPLLIHLPGCQIIWGSLEIAGGSLIHGGSRMINGMFQAMLMAIFITLGWQFFGRHWALGDPTVHPNDGVELEGSLTSLPPSIWCPAPWQVPTEGVPEVVTWYFVHTVVALPLLALINVNLNIRPRESLGPLACGLCGTVTTGFLAFGLPTAAGIPSYLQNIIVSFVTASAGNAVEFYTGLSSVVCVVPALFVFAPGSAAMMACIGSFHRDAGETFLGANVSTLWESITMTAVTYMLGVLFATQLWKRTIVHHGVDGVVRRRRAHAAAAANKDAGNNPYASTRGASLAFAEREGDDLGFKGHGLSQYRSQSVATSMRGRLSTTGNRPTALWPSCIEQDSLIDSLLSVNRKLPAATPVGRASRVCATLQIRARMTPVCWVLHTSDTWRLASLIVAVSPLSSSLSDFFRLFVCLPAAAVALTPTARKKPVSSSPAPGV